MKKVLVIFLLLIMFLITYFLQSNLFQWFTIAGIKPNLFIILVLFISLYTGLRTGLGFGIFCGLLLDMVLGKSIGIYTVMLTSVAWLGWYFDKNFSKDSRITIMLMVISATVLFEVGSYIFNVALFNVEAEIIQFIKVLSIEIVYNAILTIILYPLLQRIGYKIEDIFKEQKVLTRYF